MSKTQPMLLSGKTLAPLVDDLLVIISDLTKLAHPDKSADAQALGERATKALLALDTSLKQAAATNANFLSGHSGGYRPKEISPPP